MQSWHPGNQNRRRVWYGVAAAVLVCTGLVIYGAVRLTGYLSDLQASRLTSRELQAIYHADADSPAVTSAPSVLPVPENQTAAAFAGAPANVPAETPAEALGGTASEAPVETPAGAVPVTPVPALEAVAYPDNPRLNVSSRFRDLRKKSKYIVGWLSVDTLVDEAVVQRNNVYYLNHDAFGSENKNGAIFMDAGVSLRTRPYTILLYGHNMKSGAMFGSLRNYENTAFYHKAPLITFDSLYEEGRYVIFAVGIVSTEKSDPHYVDFLSLLRTHYGKRAAAINSIIASSVYTCMIDVQPEDQLLILVTCVDRDEDRRVVAARRIRPGEDDGELIQAVKQSRRK